MQLINSILIAAISAIPYSEWNRINNLPQPQYYVDDIASSAPEAWSGSALSKSDSTEIQGSPLSFDWQPTSPLSEYSENYSDSAPEWSGAVSLSKNANSEIQEVPVTFDDNQSFDWQPTSSSSDSSAFYSESSSEWSGASLSKDADNQVQESPLNFDSAQEFNWQPAAPSEEKSVQFNEEPQQQQQYWAGLVVPEEFENGKQLPLNLEDFPTVNFDETEPLKPSFSEDQALPGWAGVSLSKDANAQIQQSPLNIEDFSAKDSKSANPTFVNSFLQPSNNKVFQAENSYYEDSVPEYFADHSNDLGSDTQDISNNWKSSFENTPFDASSFGEFSQY